MKLYNGDDVVAFCEFGEFLHFFIEVGCPDVLDVGVMGGEYFIAWGILFGLRIPLGFCFPVALLHSNDYN